MSSRSISKSVLWQLGGKFALQGIAFFTTPIFTRILTPADYGLTALYGSWETIVSLFIGLQTLKAIRNARIKLAPEKMDSFLSSIMTISVISFMLFLCAAFFFNGFFSKILGLRGDLVILLVVHSFCLYIISFFIEKLDQNKQVEKSALLSFSQSCAAIILSMLFVLLSKNNKAVAKIYGNALPIIFYGATLLFVIYHKGRCLWNREWNKFCFIYSFPLIIHAVAHLIFTQSDRIMLNSMSGGQSLGIYSVAYNLCFVLTIIIGSLDASWTPFYYDFKKSGNIAEIQAHAGRMVKFFTGISIGFILLSYDVYKLLAPESYWEGLKLLPFFTVANFFHFMYGFPGSFEFYNARTKLIPLGTIAAALFNIIINYLLIPNYGITGAAIGTVAAFGLLFVFHDCMCRFVIRKDYEYKNFYGYFIGLAAVAAVCAFLYFFEVAWYIRWPVALLIAAMMIKDILKNRNIF